MNVSILILTLNEELNLPACLANLKWCDDIIVFDSFSSDRTIEIAKTAGARVIQRAFDNYGNQREVARTTVSYKYPWVLSLDADESLDEALLEEVWGVASKPGELHAAYRMRRKDFFMGKWIRHSTLYPSWFIRLYKPDRIHYEPRKVHEYPTVAGDIGQLNGHLVHHSFNKGLGEWFIKHVRYAELEARESLAEIHSTKVNWRGIFSFSDPIRRRRSLKSFSSRLPFRPTLRFLYMYLFRLGVLDGIAGFRYCRMLSIYEYMIVLRMREFERKEKGQPI